MRRRNRTRAVRAANTSRAAPDLSRPPSISWTTLAAGPDGCAALSGSRRMAPTAAVPRHNQLPNLLSPPLCAHHAPHLPCSPPSPSTTFRSKHRLSFFFTDIVRGLFSFLLNGSLRRRVWRHRMADVLVLAECQRITAGAKTSPCCIRPARNCSLRTPLWMRAAVGTGPR